MSNEQLNFNLNTYQQAWQQINQSKIIPHKIDINQPIALSIFDCIPSTNTKVWELINRGLKCPLGAIAFSQTAGKGQWGHSWISVAGGLYLSVGLDLDLEINNYPHLVMATAWGVGTTLRHYQLPVTIKWSNDLILNQRKLGGIKIETRNNNNKLVQAVVGIGINWQNPAPEPGINLQSYYQAENTQAISSLEELTAIATYGILLGYEYYLTVGIDQLLDKYLEILASLGQQVNFNGCAGEVVGVTTEGKLRVKLRSPGATTVITLSPGQISLGYSSSLQKHV
ncbi:MAG: biotin--[acetyl-CoA-carboxylase] ligase [Pleurocapsa sp. CRU_1_2]|nr:biotin--[acetyl-CoA-carboxylase] ligase [Pleurocapsa sp. CRU_1_2]